MLSWGLEQPTPNSEQKLVTGRVVKNMMAVFRSGVPETLEVKLKLNVVHKIHRPQTSNNSEAQRGYGSNAPTPTPTDGNSEWSSFIQSNPNLGRPTTGLSMPSPGLPPVRYGSPIQAPSPAANMYEPLHAAPTPPPTGPTQLQLMPMPSLLPGPLSQGLAADDISTSRPNETAQSVRPKQTKRASSKAPKKKRTTVSTGNPRGRPPKHGRPDSGNTSALEDVTDADEMPEAPAEGLKKKRAKTTKADWPNKAPLNSAPGSLRVAASTSGSLRTMRPAASGNSGVGGSHLQEIPRAPTPVPGSRPRGRPVAPGQPRRSSVAEFEGSMRFQVSEAGIPGPHMQDARSPSESVAQSPFQAYTPEESPGDIGSSPPMPRSAHSVRSSPPPSSPILPLMPMPPPDSGFMSGGLDEIADGDEIQLPSSMPPQPIFPGRPKLAPKSKGAKLKKQGQAARSKGSNNTPHPGGPPRPASRGLPEPPSATLLRSISQGLPEPPTTQARPVSHGLPEPPPSAPPRPLPQGLPEPPPGSEAELVSNGPAGSKEMVIQHVYPGPPELLPKSSLYNPSGSTKNQMNNSRGTGAKAAVRQLKRSNTEPNLQRQDLPQPVTGPPPMPQPPADLEHAIQEVQQSQATNESMAEVPMQSIDEPQVPTPRTTEPGEDPDEHLLRLLSEPAECTQDGDSELPPMTAMNKSYASARQPSGAMAQVPASDPGVLAPANSPPTACTDTVQTSKNLSRKQSIKEKLDQAVQMGQMPTFCSNCGAISTPTWRRIWTRDCDGSPEFPVYSDKPGCITAIVILQRDENEKPTKYQVIKKALGPAEDKSKWTEDILCNREYCVCHILNGYETDDRTACGIWLSKFKSQRPEERWEKDVNQKSRKKRGTKKGKGGQGTSVANLTSEAYFTTDPIGPDDQDPSPPKDGDEVMLLRGPTTEPPSRERGLRSQTSGLGESFDYPDRLGSTHSRGSGTVQTPVALEESDLGKTRRLLFPSPRKDGQPKVLCDVAVNVVKTSPSTERFKNAAGGKENTMIGMDLDVEMDLLATPKVCCEDDMADLFGTPSRPSTPPPKEKSSGVFKTPTRPTPSHRPITRSISKSIRSVRSIAKSPGHTLHQLQRTPTKTPRSSVRRRNGNTSNHHAHFAFDESITGGMSMEFGSPFSSTLNQLLSEANDFTVGSSAHGLGELDLLPNMGSDTGLSGHLESLDFGHFLTTDAVMPSSPPMLNRNGLGPHVSFGDASMSFDGWVSFGDMNMDGVINEGDMDACGK